jgi:hypothetical protein
MKSHQEYLFSIAVQGAGDRAIASVIFVEHANNKPRGAAGPTPLRTS